MRFRPLHRNTKSFTRKNSSSTPLFFDKIYPLFEVSVLPQCTASLRVDKVKKRGWHTLVEKKATKKTYLSEPPTPPHLYLFFSLFSPPLYKRREDGKVQRHARTRSHIYLYTHARAHVIIRAKKHARAQSSNDIEADLFVIIGRTNEQKKVRRSTNATRTCADARSLFGLTQSF